MLGFLVGTVSLLLLVKTVRRWRYGRYGGHCGHGYHGHDGHHGHHGDGSWASWRMRTMARRLFRFLDTTPGQEKVILAEMEGLEAAWRAMREELSQTRSSAADFLRKESLSDINWDDFMGRQRAVMDKTRDALKDAFMHVHAALDETQRHKLADMMEGMRRRGGFRGHGEVI